MVDNGAASAGDVTANDNIFSASFSRTFTTPGDYWFAAKVDGDSGPPLLTRIQALPVPTRETVDRRLVDLREVSCASLGAWIAAVLRRVGRCYLLVAA
jgi:hypothetical protein